jgi:hypothetical protein
MVGTPLIGPSVVTIEAIGDSFREFLNTLAGDNPVSGSKPEMDPVARGMVAHEVHPVALGGDPIDPANRILITLEKYVELVAWWNRQIRNSRNSF